MLICQHHTTNPQHLTCWNSPCHEEWASMASILQGRRKGKNGWAKTRRMYHFFRYCPLSHSLSNAYHTGCHDRVSSSIGHGGRSSFSQIIHIQPTVKLAVELVVELPVQLLVYVYDSWKWVRTTMSYTTVSENEDVTLQLPHLCQLGCDIAVRHYTEERTSWSRSFRLEIVLVLSNLFHKSISSQYQLLQLQPTTATH